MARIDLRENVYMERFVGQDHIDSNETQFWYQLLSCSFNFMRVQDPKIVDKTLDPYLNLLALNNSRSNNIGSLIRVAINRVSRIRSDEHGMVTQNTNPYYIYQSFNALYLVRCICKNYIENSSEEKLVQSFRARIENPANSKPANHPQVQPPLQQNNPIPQTQAQPIPPPLSSIQNTDPTTTNPENDINNRDNNQNIAVQPNAEANNLPNNVQNPIVAQDESKKIETTSGLTMLEQFISTLIEIIVDFPLTDATYLLHVEAINSLLVLLSVQMYTNTPANQSITYRCLMQKRASIHSLILTKTLLNNFVRQQQMPQETGSIIIGLASGLWKVLTLGYGTQVEEEDDDMPLLARQSLLLLNILTNHHTSEKNPYREAIIACQDSRFNLSDPQLAFANANNDAMVTASTSKSALTSNSIKIDFHELYETICKHLTNDQVALLLYLLLHSNKIFRPYILTTASTNLDSLVMPLLKILYSSIERGSHHVYMVLIIFIILSEESAFSKAIHSIKIHGVPWYKDRIINEITLGSLTALIIIRSFQYNTIRVKDKFLHSNLFATLANLSNHFDHLHPYVCQRLIDLLERLSKRYLAATKPASKAPEIPSQAFTVFDSNHQLARALATDTPKQDLQDISSIELDSTGQSTVTNGGNLAISIPEQPSLVSPVENNNDNVNNMIPPISGYQQASDGQQSPNSNSTSEHVSISMEESKQDLSLVEEVIRMILEVINNTLSTQLEVNPDLIYTLLYKRNVFSSLLSSHQSFYNMVINVERILTYFYNKIDSFQRSLSAEEIKELIDETSKEWTNVDQPKDPNSRLLFHYVEDEQPEEFFIPYIWTRIYYSSGIAWNPKRITLFNPEDL